jgi:hypothetical protein
VVPASARANRTILSANAPFCQKIAHLLSDHLQCCATEYSIDDSMHGE